MGAKLTFARGESVLFFLARLMRRCAWRPRTANIASCKFYVGLNNMPAGNPLVWTTTLLIASNVFMTFAWYAHLKNLGDKPWYIAALVSWGIALFEYLLQVPANRIGFTELNLGQLKIMQEVITLAVFVPFAIFYMHEKLSLNYLWAGLCLLGAVYFMFKG